MERCTDSGRECRPLLGLVWWTLGMVAGWLKMQNSASGPAGPSWLSCSLCSEAQPRLCSTQGLSRITWNPLAIPNYSLLQWASRCINWVLDIKDILKDQVMFLYPTILGFPGGTPVKILPAMQETQEMCIWSLLGRSPEGNGNPFQLFLPGKSHGQRSLAGYSPWCLKSD